MKNEVENIQFQTE